MTRRHAALAAAETRPREPLAAGLTPRWLMIPSSATSTPIARASARRPVDARARSTPPTRTSAAGRAKIEAPPTAAPRARSAERRADPCRARLMPADVAIRRRWPARCPAMMDARSASLLGDTADTATATLETVRGQCTGAPTGSASMRC